MNLGNSTNDTLAGFSSQNLNIGQPYLKVEMPIVDQKIRETRGTDSGCEFLNMQKEN